jgi:phosphatidylglycerol---prolipoprotein diacylglyceryl transferase
MTFPLIIQIGVVAIPFHPIAEILSFYLGFKYFQFLKKKKGDHVVDVNRWWVILGAAIGALLGSRLLAALENHALFFNPPNIFYYYLSGKTVIGGVVGGIVGVEIMKKIIGEKKRTGDLFVFPLMLAIIIGRIGCLFTGVSDGTVGNPSNMPWAFDQGDGIPRHPTSLYEIIFLLILWPILAKISKRGKLKEGVLFKLFIISYLTFRYFIEFIKDTIPFALGLSAIQIVCLVTALIYLYKVCKSRHSKKTQLTM